MLLRCERVFSLFMCLFCLVQRKDDLRWVGAWLVWMEGAGQKGHFFFGNVPDVYRRFFLGCLVQKSPKWHRTVLGKAADLDRPHLRKGTSFALYIILLLLLFPTLRNLDLLDALYSGVASYYK